MSATLYERMGRFGDYENDGGDIAHTAFHRAATLYVAGLADDDYVADEMTEGYGALTTPQRADLDELLGTVPASLLFLVNAYQKAEWADRVFHTMLTCIERKNGMTTEAAFKTALGV